MLYQTLVVTIPIFILTVLIVRSVLFGIFDPFVLTLFSVSASLGVMFHLSYPNRLLNDGLAIVFVLSHLAFIAGLLVGNRGRVRVRRSPFRVTFLKLSYIDTLAVTVAGVIFLCFVTMMVTTGLIILQQDVVVARTTLLTGGFGILKRVIEPGITLSFALLLVRNHYRPVNQIVFWLNIAFLIVVSYSMGSKGFLFTFFALYVYYFTFVRRQLRFRLSKRVWGISLLVFALVLVGASVNLVFSSIRSGESLNSSLLLSVFTSLADRIAGFGDIGYLFFENDAYLILQKNVQDYFEYLSNDIAGFLRLRPYGNSPGAQIYAIVTNSDNLEGHGPNAQVYFVGYMFFQFFGILYSFVIGWLFAYIRRTICLNFRISNLDMLIFIVANSLIYPMGMDFQLVLGQIFNMLLTMVPLSILVFVVYSVLNGKSAIVFMRFKQIPSPYSAHIFGSKILS